VKATYRVRIVALVEIFNDSDGSLRRILHDATDVRSRSITHGPVSTVLLAPESEAVRINRALGDVAARAPDTEGGLV